MDRYNQNLIGILKRYLSDNNINIISENEGYLELSNPSVPNKNISAQYVISSPIDKNIHGSKNNTIIDTIARSLLPDLQLNSPPRFFIFPFHNKSEGKLNFAVVPSQILIERSHHKFKTDIIKPPYEIVFWLMPDNYLYDCTNISVEGEWFFLSKGANGRMADNTDRNYTSFLNNWGLLANVGV